MSPESGQTPAMLPLWLLTTGLVAGSALSQLATVPTAASLCWLLTAIGAGLLAAVLRSTRTPRVWWLLIGLTLAGSRGALVNNETLRLQNTLQAEPDLTVRVHATVSEGWRRSRWGYRTRLKVQSATLRGADFRLPRRLPVEVRGHGDPGALPDPGSAIATLARPQYIGDTLRLLVSSPRLLETTRRASGIAAVRERLATSLLEAADTDVRRIRAAEFAAAISLGRRDLIPPERARGWRQSGLAHLLAVSGLHVGIIVGVLWLTALATGLGPRGTRLLMIIVLPLYAVLAGAAPSCTRATIMAVLYFGLRFFGRSLIPIAAVFLTVGIMLLGDPTLVAQPGFQLTAAITAALVRWTPALVEFLRGPRWFRVAIAIPVLAQLAAAPILAVHFRSLIPGAIIANLVVPWILTPTLVCAVAAALLSPLSHHLGAFLIDLVALGRDLLWASGSAGRMHEWIAPPTPVLLTLAFVVLGWYALGPLKTAFRAAASWLVLLVVLRLWWAIAPVAAWPGIALLPVGEGLAALISAGEHRVLFDAGRSPNECALLLAEAGVRELDGAFVSHGDEDHIGGMQRIVETMTVRELVLPEWMRTDQSTVPLIRACRRHGTRLSYVSQGSRLQWRELDATVQWPPFHLIGVSDNDRSLVATFETRGERILVTADCGNRIERQLAQQRSLAASILVIPHHGSRHSTSQQLLDATDPRIALIPAGPRNPHGHPHLQVIRHLSRRHILMRMPAQDGWCGAKLRGRSWRPVP